MWSRASPRADPLPASVKSSLSSLYRRHLPELFSITSSSLQIFSRLDDHSTPPPVYFTCTHAESPRTPSAAYATLCKVVVRKQRDFWQFFVTAQPLCVACGCDRGAGKRLGSAPSCQHSPRARCPLFRPASDPQGSRKIRATR